MQSAPAWRRRARALLGTLVEVAVPELAWQGARVDDAVQAAFAAVEQAQRVLSRFDPQSDISLFHALRCGQALRLRPQAREVLAAAQALRAGSGGVFDISVGSAPEGWALEEDELVKRDAAVRLDLGGIAKGHAVDLAVRALLEHGCGSGCVNAGGDLRAFGAFETTLRLRDEDSGGVRDFARLSEGAFATSAFGPDRRAQLAGLQGDAPQAARSAHVSVAAPLCLWADALTKIVAASGDAGHPLLARYDARAWMH